MIKVFIGYDPRESVAFHVCADSIIRNSSESVEIIPLHLPHLRGYTETHKDGSNSFIYSRFLVPSLCDFQGIAIYLDGDMVITGDIAELAICARTDLAKAVFVAKHEYKTKAQEKYLGNRNEDYPRKNWSSVIVWNCASYLNRHLLAKFVEEASGEQLHRFQWLPDERIGDLPLEWNWLVGEYEPNFQAKLYHYTLGIPDFPEYSDSDHSNEWETAKKLMLQCGEQP